MKTHTVPAPVFAEFAAGRGGTEGIAFLSAAEHSKHLVLIRGVRDHARTLGHPQAEHAGRAYAELARLQGAAPDAVTDVLNHPPVGAWALHTIRALERPGTGEAVPAQLGGLAAAVAVRAGLPCEIHVPVVAGTAVLPSLGRMRGLTGSDSVRVRSGRSGASVGDRPLPAELFCDVPGWEGLRRLTVGSGSARFSLLVEDVDPFRAPGSSTSGGRLTDERLGRWRDLLESAWDLLVRHHPEAAAEIGAATRTLVPLTPLPAGLTSFTSRETYGSVAISDPPDPVMLAVTLAHEVQHAKLSALQDIVPMIRQAGGEDRHYAPWRDDPRPLGGLLQGIYAHLAVVAFWHRQRLLDEGLPQLRAHTEFARWREATAHVTRTVLASDRLTTAGTEFVTGLSRALAPYLAEPVPEQVLKEVRRKARDHRARWLREHGDAVRS